MTNLTDGPVSWFTADHRSCDSTWAKVEAAVDAGDATLAADTWIRFDDNLRRHLSMEEEVLFPALAAAGMPHMGPIQVMLMEHEQMRAVLDTMAGCADGGDWEGLADHGDTLLMLIQQHNVKEEGILYPMAGQLLARTWTTVADKLQPYLA